MENAHTLTEPSELDMVEAMKSGPSGNPLMERLKGIAEAMLDAFEATPVPKDHAEIGKAARTLISLTRLIKLVYDEAKPRASRAKPLANREKAVSPLELASMPPLASAEAFKDEVPEVVPETAPQARPAPVNRKQRRFEDKRSRSINKIERAMAALSPALISP